MYTKIIYRLLVLNLSFVLDSDNIIIQWNLSCIQ